MADDLSADSVAPRGVDLLAARAGSFVRGGTVAASPSTYAPTNLITGVTTANPGVVTTTTAHGLVTGQLVGIFGVSGATQANGVWVVTVLSATTFSIPVNVSGTYSGSGGTFIPATAGVAVEGHGTLRLDQIISAHSGTSPALAGSVWTSYDNGVTDAWRQLGSTLATQTNTNSTVRQVFTGLDRWICYAAQVSGTTPSVTVTVSGELV